VAAIVEEADCSPEQLAVRELNTGIYAFERRWLWSSLPEVPPSAKGEYYLTDLVAMAVAQGHKVCAIQSRDADELLGINDRTHLACAEAVMRGRINRRHMLAGVTLRDPMTTYISAEVAIGQDTVILPNTVLEGRTHIGRDCVIGPNTVVRESRIGDRCRVDASFVEEAAMEDDANVGPFGHLRKGAHLGSGVHMGNFGEVKNSTLGARSKMGHFSYMGDAQVGEDVNIGAGTITCNFDGERKNPTVIEDGAFIGSDTLLVAPVRVGKGARTGAGSVVTRDVPPGAVAVGMPARALAKRRPVPEPSSGDKEQ
jgi:bifunctional UDP-N-acetylglucosamine pyrophosphorylase/glucosamine-1-phosphate N-acetyltransferase